MSLDTVLGGEAQTMNPLTTHLSAQTIPIGTPLKATQQNHEYLLYTLYCKGIVIKPIRPNDAKVLTAWLDEHGQVVCYRNIAVNIVLDFYQNARLCHLTAIPKAQAEDFYRAYRSIAY